MGWSCPTSMRLKKREPRLLYRGFRSDQSCVQGIAPLDALISIPKRKSHKRAVQKMQVVVQKMQVKQSFSFVLLLKQATNVRRKESSHEKMRSMLWKAGIGHPLP